MTDENDVERQNLPVPWKKAIQLFQLEALSPGAALGG